MRTTQLFTILSVIAFLAITLGPANAKPTPEVNEEGQTLEAREPGEKVEKPGETREGVPEEMIEDRGKCISFTSPPRAILSTTPYYT